MAENTQNIRNGNKVLFVGGPEAGRVRIVPESVGDHLRGDGDFLYRIWPFKMQGSKDELFFACSADQHPMQMLLELWREYSPAAQIKGEMGDTAMSYQTVKPAGK